MDCYSCKHRRDLPGSCHSRCEAFGEATELLSLSIMSMGVTTYGEISFEPHGFKNGWCIWPANFDPIWIKHCNFYEGKL